MPVGPIERRIADYSRLHLGLILLDLNPHVDAGFETRLSLEGGVKRRILDHWCTLSPAGAQSSRLVAQ